MKSSSDLYTRVTGSMGFEPEEKTCCDATLIFCEDEICAHFPTLTWAQRLIACAIVTGVGFMMSMGSFLKFTELIHGNPIPFVAQYTGKGQASGTFRSIFFPNE